MRYDSKQEAFDQIHNIDAHLLLAVTDEIPHEAKNRLRHGRNLVLSLARAHGILVKHSDLDMLQMNS